MKIWMIATYAYVLVMSFSFLILTLVVTIGGIFDIRDLLRALKDTPTNESDDGRTPIERPGPTKAEINTERG